MLRQSKATTQRDQVAVCAGGAQRIPKGMAMDLAMIRDHLEQARQHVALGARHIARQHELVAELSGGGHDDFEARRLLRLFEDCQKLHLADRDRLELMLAAEMRRQAG